MIVNDLCIVKVPCTYFQFVFLLGGLLYACRDAAWPQHGRRGRRVRTAGNSGMYLRIHRHSLSFQYIVTRGFTFPKQRSLLFQGAFDAACGPLTALVRLIHPRQYFFRLGFYMSSLKMFLSTG
jgi:hypothetical protein